MSIVASLKTVRVAQSRTVREVAKTASLPERTLYSAEKSGRATTSTLEAWARALNVQILVVPADTEISASA